MTLLSLTAYAATHGASRQAAAKWKNIGAIVTCDGMVDVEKSDVNLKAAGLGRFKTERGRAQPDPATKSVVAPRNRRKVAPAVAGVVDEIVSDFEWSIDAEEIDGEIAAGFVAGLLEGRFGTKVQAAALKENALALKHWLVAQKEADKLVEMEVAQRVIFDDRRAARDAWMAFPGRFAPLLAADLDIDGAKLAEALKPYVHQLLDELGEPDLDFSDTDEG